MKRKGLLKVLFLLLLSIISSCGAGVNNASEDLSGDSFFYESGSSLNSIISHNNLHKPIYSIVLCYVYNRDFILAVQEPNFEYHKALLASDLNNGKDNFDKLEKLADSILIHDPYYVKIFSKRINFWIIANSTNELLGPFTFKEYIIKRKQLNIPEDLKLDNRFNE